jgi:hypothetical protein
LIDKEGKFQPDYLLSYKHYPPELQTLASRVQAELVQEAEVVVSLLAWFFDIPEAHGPLKTPTLYWKITGKYYHIVKSSSMTLYSKSPAGIAWTVDNQNVFASILRLSSNHPLAHELHREANALISYAPRSALLMLSSALEVGVKRYVSEALPSTEWILMELQSPPIHKILKDYIATVPSHSAHALDQWNKLKPMFSRIQRRIEDRNRLTHRGTMDVSNDELVAFSQDVGDVLYALDVLRGQEWARHNLRKETCRELGWPDPIPFGPTVSVVVSVVED